MDKTAKIILIAGLVALVIVGASMFFAGRGSAGGSMATKISDLKTVLDGTVGKWNSVVSDLGSIRKDIDSMGTKLTGLDAKLDELNDNFSDGIYRLNGSIDGNKKLYEQYFAEMERARSEVEQFRRVFDAGTKFIESVDESVP